MLDGHEFITELDRKLTARAEEDRLFAGDAGMTLEQYDAGVTAPDGNDLAAAMLARARNFLSLESPDAPEPTLGDLVRDLARARFSVATLKNLAACHQLELEKTAEWAALQGVKSTLAGAQARVEEAESTVRAAAAEQYGRDSNKHPHPAVTVRIYETLVYDRQAALSYAINHLPHALSLDARAFEKTAKTIPLDFVEIRYDPRPAIATDLSGWLNPVEMEEKLPF